MPLLLGIDAGTTTVSVLLFDTDTARVIRSVSKAHGAYVPGLAEYRREQDPDAIARALADALSSLFSDGETTGIDGICVTGQMHGFMFLDGDLRRVGNFITWEDQRALQPSPRGVPWLVELEGALDETTRVSSCPRSPGFASTNLFVMTRAEAPAGQEVAPEARWIVSIQDWLVTELAGETSAPPLTDPTCAHSTGLSFLDGLHWNEPLLRALGADRFRLPDIVAAGTPAGRVGKAGAKRYGLPAGIPVCVGLGDNQASFLGSVSDHENTVLLNVGTGSQVSVCVPQPRHSDGIGSRPFFGGNSLLVGAPLCGGRAVAILANFLKEIGTQVFDVDLSSDRLFQRIQAVADIETELYCRVTFAGSRKDPGERGALLNLGTENFRIGDLAGSLIRGIAEELRELFDLMGVHRTGFVGAGNGVRKNLAIRRSLESVFGGDLQVPAHEEEAALGAALTAGIGLELFESPALASKLIRYLEPEQL